MLDKINRKSFQIKKEESLEVEFQSYEKNRNKVISKSRFAKTAGNELNEFGLFNSAELQNENDLSKISSPEVADFSPMVLEKSLPLDDNDNEGYLMSKNFEESKKEKLQEILYEKEGNINSDLFLKFSKIDESAFKYIEENNENTRIRSRSGNYNNKTKSNLTDKLTQLQLTKAIKELKHPNLEDLNNTKSEELIKNDDCLASPTLQMSSPTLKKASLDKSSNIIQLKNQIKFLNNMILTFSLITEFVQKLTDDNKVPTNIKFWFNEQKTNLQFLIGKLTESEINPDYQQKSQDLKKFTENLMELAEVFFKMIINFIYF